MERDKAIQRKSKMKLRKKQDKNLCVCCGAELDREKGGADEGRKSCWSCRHPTERPERIYAGHQMYHAQKGLHSNTVG